MLALGFVFILGGIVVAVLSCSFVMLIAGVLVGAVFLYLYSLNKTMRFSIYTGGDKPIASISIKKSVIEGQSIDPSKYESTAGVLHTAVLNARRQNIAVSMAGTTPQNRPSQTVRAGSGPG